MSVSIRFVDADLYFREGDMSRLESEASAIAGDDLKIVDLGEIEGRGGALLKGNLFDRLAQCAWPSGDFPFDFEKDVARVVGLFEPGSHIDIFDEDAAQFLRCEVLEKNGTKTVVERFFDPFCGDIPWNDCAAVALE